MKTSGYWVLVVVCGLALLTGACKSSGDQAAEGMAEQVAALEEQRSALEAKRAELSSVEEQIAAAAEAPEEEVAEGEEAAPAEDLPAKLDALKSEEEAMSESYMTALVGVLNSANLLEGEPVPEPIQQVIGMKSAEDMMIAEEYIWEGGDYRRAIEILDTALMLDPDNPDLQAARDKAHTDQYMTEERFALVEKGMTPEEVRALIGTVNRHNLREYPERNVTAWFYRREDKGAAGVWFEEKNGEIQAYRVDYNAIAPPEEEGGEAAEIE